MRQWHALIYIWEREIIAEFYWGVGYSHIKTLMICRSNESLFHKKSLNMGPIFYKNIVKHEWSIFPKCSGVWLGKHPKIVKSGPLSQVRKIPKNGYNFAKKYP